MGQGTYGGVGNNNGNYANVMLVPRVQVAPTYYGGGIGYVTIPTRTMQRQVIARQFFAAGGIRLGGGIQRNLGYPVQQGRQVYLR